jgi:2-aminoadipate transaminase
MLPLKLSERAKRTGAQPISWFMQQAVENPNLISLAAGLVDAESLPLAETRAALDEILSDPRAGRAALQYGTTQGYAPLREKILARALTLDHVQAKDLSLTPDDVVIATGSQQLLYMLGEVLLDPDDIVITEAPSYFVYHGVLGSIGVRTLTVPMDEQGMDTDALEELLKQLEAAGELPRVKLIYTVDYFQNPTGLTLSLPRRQKMLELAQRYSKQQRIFILEDAAYRELRYDGADLPSIKSFDERNETVILAMTFSKPMAPGVKTGYGILPRDLVAPVLHFKGNHDFGSSNLCQHLLDRVMGSGDYEKHVAHLRDVYRGKRDVLLAGLVEQFPQLRSPMRWTKPAGGMYVWLRCPAECPTGPGTRFMDASLREGVLYVPGRFCHMPDEQGETPDTEARLCFGVATPEQLREACRRLGRAAAEAMPAKITMKAFAGCKG